MILESSWSPIEDVLDNPLSLGDEDVMEEKNWHVVIKKVEREIVWEKLTKRQEKFCQLYATDTEFFGNWVQSYLEVYDIDTTKKWWYNTATVCASQLLVNPKVYNRINELLDEQGLNDAFVDKQLLFVISQQDDFTNKMAAIKEYNKLKQRITDKISLEWNPFSTLLEQVRK